MVARTFELEPVMVMLPAASNLNVSGANPREIMLFVEQ